MFDSIQFKIEGISPLLMHNVQLANPLNPLVKQIKAITCVRKKSDEQFLELSRLEFRAGLYLSAKGAVIVPSVNLEACLVEGAKKSRLGKQFKSAVCVLEDSLLDYGEQLSVDELWDRSDEFVDVRACGVGASKVMRTRPIFRNWSCLFTVHYNSDLVNVEQVQLALVDAGAQCGVGDWRPRFGRFQVVE